MQCVTSKSYTYNTYLLVSLRSAALKSFLHNDYKATTVLGYTISKRWIRIYGFSLRCIRICSIYQVDIGYMARCVRICSLKSNMGLDIQ